MLMSNSLTDSKLSGSHGNSRSNFASNYWNIPEKFSTDGGSQVIGEDNQQWLKEWNIRHHLSSAYLSHSNSRAEVAVKAAKRLLQDCVSASGEINTDKFVRAMMSYCNTIHQDSRWFSAELYETIYQHSPLNMHGAQICIHHKN